MKTLRAFLYLIILVGFGVLFYKYDIESKKEQNRQSVSQEMELKELEQVKNKIDDTALIQKALKSVGILCVLEGSEVFKKTIEEETWYSYRGITLDWTYRFALAMNLEDVGVSVDEGIVHIAVDPSRMFVQFIEKTKESSSRSEASWLAKKYSSQEISTLEKAVLEKVEEKIKATPEYWDQAQKSLETSLVKLCNDLGYYHINFRK